MSPEEHARMYRVETEHFWFRGTRDVILGALEKTLGPVAGRRVLDIGCGTGLTLSLLPSDVKAVGLDLSEAALAYAKTRAPHAELVRGSAYELPFEAGSFDAVLALDVLEHLDDDMRAAREAARVLRPGGVFVATVPAFSFLWSGHDEALEHRRRYRLPAFERVVRGAGFSVELASYYNFFLFPVVAASRLAERIKPKSGREDLDIPTKPLNRMLYEVLSSERHLVPNVRLPFGVSCIVVGRKK